MGSWDPTPHPLATFLLALDERAATGTVRVGGRVLALARGKVLEVGRIAGEPSVAEQLSHDGGLDDATFARLGVDAEAAAVAAVAPLPPETLHDLVRSVWVVRLARSLAQAETWALDEAPAAEGAPLECPLVALVLDALERGAGEDGVAIAGRGSASLAWTEGSLGVRGQRWLGVEGSRARRVATVLSARPGAGARLVALVRAGLLRVVDAPESPGEPLTPRDSLPSVRPPRVELAPGAAELRPSLAQRPDMPSFPPVTEQLDDPLEALEAKVAALEVEGAPSPERALAFRALGEAWLRLFGAVEEQARALRQAAALERTDAELLRRTAEACAAAGQLDVGLAYGRSAVACQTEPEARAGTLLWYALLCRRAGRASDALGAARAAEATGAPSPEARLLAAELEAAHGMQAEAHRDRREAADLVRASHPERALAWLAEAWLAAATAATSDDVVPAAEAFAGMLSSLGRLDASLAVRAHAAALAASPEARRRHRLALAERAELAERPTVAADQLVAVLDDEPALEVLYDSVDQDLDAAGLRVERALVLEDLALRGVAEWRTDLLLRAIDARIGAQLEPSWTLLLARRALALGAPIARLRPTFEALRAELGIEAVADAVEDATYELPAGTEQREAFALLVDWGATVPRGARRIARAMQQRSLTAPSALAAEVAAEERSVAEAEALLSGSVGSARRSAAIELARWLAPNVSTRDRAAALIDEVLLEVPSEEADELALRIALARGDSGALLRAALRAGSRGSDVRARRRALALVLAAASERAQVPPAREAALHLDRLGAATLETAVRTRRIGVRGADVDLELVGLRTEAAMGSGGPGAAGRARASLRIARIALAAGAVDEAAEAAERALDLAPGEGMAGLVGLLAAGRGRGSASLVARTRALFGELPTLLARAARCEPDPARSLAATVRWAALEPLSPQPSLVALEESLERGIDDFLEPGIHALSGDERAVPQAIPLLVRALGRLAERVSPARAAELARRTAIAFGAGSDSPPAPLRALALELAERVGDPAQVRAALELDLPPREATAERVAALLRIAASAREAGDRAAEVRALLRVMGASAGDDAAVSRLVQLFSMTGRTEQLVATLEHTASAAAAGGDEAKAKKALLWLAAAATQLLRSEDATQRYLDRIASLAGGTSTEGVLARADALVALGRPSEALELLRAATRGGASQGATARGARARLYERAAHVAYRELGDAASALDIAAEALTWGGPWTGRTLLLFEQLALSEARTDLAERVYGQLVAAAVGARSRRALAYRHARWLERRGDKAAALAMLVQSASESGAGGAVATSLERVAREVGDLDALARGYVALADAAKHPALRTALLRRAAAVWEDETARPEKAFDALFGPWAESLSAELEPQLARLAAAMTRADAAAGDAAFARLFSELHRRAAEAWMGDEKARFLRKAAGLHAERGEHARAAALVREALAALAGEDPELARTAEVWVELARFELARGAEESARQAVASALALEAGLASANELADQLGIPAPPSTPPPAPSRAQPPPPAASSPSPAAPAPSSPPAALPSARSSWLPAGAPPEPRRATLPPVAKVESLRPPASESPEAFAVRLAADPATRSSAATVLRALLMEEPGRFDLLVELERLAAGSPELGAAHRVSSALVSLVAPPSREPPSFALELSRDEAAALLGRLTHVGSLAPIFAILELLTENLPMYRQTLGQVGVLGTDRVAVHGHAPLSRALAHVVPLLPGAEPPPVFVSPRPDALPEVLRSAPPSVLMPVDWSRNEAELRFAIARTAELARSRGVLLGSLSEEDAATLFDAVRAAFGPADGSRVEKAAAQLAADLWRSLPVRAQRDLRELVAQAAEGWDAAQVRTALFSVATRAGLVAAGDVRSAVTGLFRCRSRGEIRFPDPRSWRTRCAGDPEFADLVRVALSDDFLAAVRPA
jgi:hypothetical protein